MLERLRCITPKLHLALLLGLLGCPQGEEGAGPLDESFVGLDPESTYALRNYLGAYCEQGGSILISSHVLDMLEAMVGGAWKVSDLTA